MAEGLFKSFPPCFIYNSERIACQEHRLFLALDNNMIPISLEYLEILLINLIYLSFIKHLLQLFSYLFFVFIKGITTYLCQFDHFRICKTYSKIFAMLLDYLFCRSLLFNSKNLTRFLSYLFSIQFSSPDSFAGTLKEILNLFFSLFKSFSDLLLC